MNRMLPSLVLIVMLSMAHHGQGQDSPQAQDPRLEVVLFAREPDIVHPISMDFDARGRLLVIESHTHFPPTNYKGLKHDRIRVLEDTDGDGRADRFSTFHEGTKATMDIATHPDGSVYLATRNEILRLRDTDGDGRADVSQRIAFLDTKGDYPHNGLSGLCFDSRGNLFFGMGENLGADYKLIGSDGTTLTDQGEGGNIYWCTSDGKRLRRVATGFWNPFGTCRDLFGRLFTVDNDPDARPPCRLLHVIEGADFGYQFRYGRSGRHPFQAWDGQLPGTLPQVSGTGEAPCEVLSYESDGLPEEYRGNLLVTSWADHRVERYALKERGASFQGDRLPFVQGGQDFRPVGLATAPDGSLFVSDWVLKDYTLHGKGAVWHIRPKRPSAPDRPSDPRQGLLSSHRPLREAAARRLSADEEGRRFLRTQLAPSSSVPIRAAALTALIDIADPELNLRALATDDPHPPLRALAVRGLVERGASALTFLSRPHPAEVRLQAIPQLQEEKDILPLLADPDPYLRHATIYRFARLPALRHSLHSRKNTSPSLRLALLLADRLAMDEAALTRLPQFLTDPDDDIRFLALKWISDLRLTSFRTPLTNLLEDRSLSLRLHAAAATALARLNNEDVSEARMADAFADRLIDSRNPPSQRTLALQLIPSSHPKLTLNLLGGFLDAAPSEALKKETLRVLIEHPQPKRLPLLRTTALNTKLPPAIRALAIVGLSDSPLEMTETLIEFASDPNTTIREEALRALSGRTLTPAQKTALQGQPGSGATDRDLLNRVLGHSFTQGRPPASDLNGWLKRLEGPAHPDAGQRVLAHPRLGACARCHRVDGRGQDVGPDLSTIGHRERRHILESILQPSSQMAPQYQVWQIETRDGKSRMGLLHRTVLDESTYVDEKGATFTLNTRHIVESRPVSRSLMPEGMVDLLTDQELRDLLAYLQSRR